MPNTINNGGPAYPTTPENEVRMNGMGGAGMSLRDYFAGQALAGRMARPSVYASWTDAALDAYEIADAMLKARESL